jgi:hypothetical protein
MRAVKTTVLLAAAATIALAGDRVWAQTQQVPRFEQEVRVEGARVAGSANDFFLTFSGPIALPGVSLGPGTYVFRREPSGLLRVLNAKREQTYVLAFTAPTRRVMDLDKYEIHFIEPLVAGAPYRISAWFAPGSSLGQELLYAPPADLGDVER